MNYLENRISKLERVKNNSDTKPIIIFAEIGKTEEELVEKHIKNKDQKYIFWPLPKTKLDE